MTSPQIIAEAAAIRKNREITEDKLDRIWDRVNALGCNGTADPLDYAYNEAIGDALTVIEAAGGKDPALRRADREYDEKQRNRLLAGGRHPDAPMPPMPCLQNSVIAAIDRFEAVVRRRNTEGYRPPHAD